jgi:hypothetical protein
MIIWKDIQKVKPHDGQRVVVYLPRRDRIQEVVWNAFQMEVLHPSHWTEATLPIEDITSEIIKLSASICGRRTSDKKKEAARRNGKRGGAPKKEKDEP